MKMITTTNKQVTKIQRPTKKKIQQFRRHCPMLKKIWYVTWISIGSVFPLIILFSDDDVKKNYAVQFDEKYH